MAKAFTLLILQTLVMIGYANNGNNEIMNAEDFSVMDISQQLLLAAKTQEPTDSLVNVIKYISENQLQTQLKNDNDKKAFWINIYNAYTQVILSKNPDRYKDRNSFFGDKVIEIAGQKLSLDVIEHGLLRGSKVKWSMGYLNKLFPSRFEKANRVNVLDYRIHFALNCGAKSCPPIAFYQPEKIDKQLDLATKAYLGSDAEYDATRNEIFLPAIMGWFRGDFGGKEKMISLLHTLEMIPLDKNPKVRFSKYDWDLFLKNYKKEA